MTKNVEDYLAFKAGKIKMPPHLAIKGQSGRLFENNFMESISKTPIWIPQILYIVGGGFLVWYSIVKLGIPFLTVIPLVLGGILLWTFAEYMVHRFVYHTETSSPGFTKFQHNAHSHHHNYPKDKYRLAMPPVPSIVLSIVFFSLFYLVFNAFGVPNYTFAFFPGFWWGYLGYITIHYMQHVIRMPKYPPARKLWEHHAVHHYKNPYVAHGVSTRLWDWVFGTMPEKQSKE
jgi:4-hydroxysphinganine ceramide fatty acyl 2-hydroxylase